MTSRVLPQEGAASRWSGNISLSGSGLARAGRNTLDLLEHTGLWVNRRVDTIKFVDEHLARHRISVDFQLPPGLEKVFAADPGAQLIPVTVVRRSSDLERFDVKHDDGNDLPLVNRFLAARLGAVALREKAERVLGASPSDELVRLLVAVATDPPNDDADPSIVEALIDPRSAAWFSPNLRNSFRERRVLCSDDGFCNLVALLALGSPVMVSLQARAGRRQIIKVGWDEWISESGSVRADQTQSLRHRASLSLGFTDTVTALDMSLIGGAGAHHVQIEAPVEVELTTVELKGFKPRDRLTPEVLDRGSDEPEPIYLIRQRGPLRRVQLYLDDTPDVAMGSLRAELRGSHGGFMRGALAAAFLVTATLWLYFLRSDEIARQTSSASVLLLVPGLLAAYIVRPGEHLLARKLRRSWRWLLTVDGVLALISAAAFVAYAPGPNAEGTEIPRILGMIWLICAVFATAILGVLIGSWWRSRVKD